MIIKSSGLERPVWLNTYRPDLTNEQSFIEWKQFHELVKTVDVPIVVNGAWNFIEEMLATHQEYLGGGMQYMFWFDSFDDRAKFIEELTAILPRWIPYLQLS